MVFSSIFHLHDRIQSDSTGGMVCLRLIGHHLHGNRCTGRRDRVESYGLHIFAGTDQPGLTQNIPSSSRIRSLSQMVLLSGLVSHISARLPSNKTAPHTPTWNAWASSSCQPNSSGTSGIPDTADSSKGGGVNSPCAGLCVYTRAAAIIARHSSRLSPKRVQPNFFYVFAAPKRHHTPFPHVWTLAEPMPGHQRSRDGFFPAP